MQPSKYLKSTILIGIAILPLVYMAFVWGQIPQEVPIHFNDRMEPNGFVSKSSLWMVIGTLCALAIFCYFLLSGINKLDPKRVSKDVPSTINKLAVVSLIFITALNFLTLFSSVHNEQKLMDKLLYPMLGLLFLLLGNYMYNIKPNYFAGFRLPWTLSNDYNWKKTHHLGGIVWFIGGIVITIISLLVPASKMGIPFESLIGAMVIIPVVYSFWLFKQGNIDHTPNDKLVQ
jgi:uncharacterized membrane protein